MRRAIAIVVLVRSLSLSITSDFYTILFTCASQTKIAKTPKSNILGVQSHSRALTLTPLKGVSLVRVIISSMSASICKRFHATQANSAKITTVRVPFLTPPCAALLEPRGVATCSYKIYA